MGKVVANASVSLDGYIAKDDNTIGRLFDWLQNGDVEIPTPAGDFAVHLSRPAPSGGTAGCPASARWCAVARCSTSRTAGTAATPWTCRSSSSRTRCPTAWVEAHPDAPFHFVTDGVAAAVAKAQEIAGDRTSP